VHYPYSLELSKKAYFLFKQLQKAQSENPRLLNFRVRTQHGSPRSLTATVRQGFNVSAVTNAAWQREEAEVATSSGPRPIWPLTLFGAPPQRDIAGLRSNLEV
jgi:hypothetical protein